MDHNERTAADDRRDAAELLASLERDASNDAIVVAVTFLLRRTIDGLDLKLALFPDASERIIMSQPPKPDRR